MTREELIDRIGAVLVTHDTSEFSSWCLCGKHLYSGGVNATGAMSLRRHRAESIIDALDLEVTT